MAKGISFNLILLLLVSLSFAALTQTQVVFNVYYPFSNVSITDVIISSNPFYSGASTDIYVTLANGGTIDANVSVNVSIFNSTGGLVDNLTYAPAIVPAFSTLTISQSWSSGSNAIGTYFANASGLYESGTNATNVFSRQFELTLAPTPTPSTGPGSSGSSVSGSTPSDEAAPRPTILPPEIKPITSKVTFLRSTPLKEISAGSSAFESIVIRNSEAGSRSVSINITGIPKSWLSFEPKKAIMLPNEDRAINIGLTVPLDALPGDYLVRIDVSENAENAADFMILRVKSPTRGAQNPIVLKTIRLDRGLGATFVSIDLINPTTKPIAYVKVIDEIIRQLRVSPEDIEFAGKPAMVMGDPLQIAWSFRELAPLEKVTVSYSVYSLLLEYRPYVYWGVKQIEVSPKEIKLSEIVTIREISSTIIGEEGEGIVHATLFYAGFEPTEFRATLELPAGFTVEPLTFSGVLNPRGTTDVEFKVRAPPGSDGTHTATLSVLLDEEFLIQQTGYVTVQRPIALSWQYIFGGIVLTALFILSLFHYLGKKKDKSDREQHIALREGYIKQIKRHIE